MHSRRPDGPDPLVTQKALQLGLPAILVVNKIDRDGCDPQGAVNKVFRSVLRAQRLRNSSLTSRSFYASGRKGTCRKEMSDEDSVSIFLWT